MFLPDFMHEVELGSWRVIYIHSLRIVEAHGGPSLIAELDRRCVLISIPLMNGRLIQASNRDNPAISRYHPSDETLSGNSAQIAQT